MEINPLRKIYKKNYLHLYQDQRVTFGFTEIGFSLPDLADYCRSEKIVHLKQVHSNKILLSSEIDENSRGDGIILDQCGVIAVIKTADCIPLFFWSDDFSTAGILHIGWQGLFAEIEKNLLAKLSNKVIKIESLNFFTGPGIEAGCYEVGNDLWLKFITNKNRNKIFYPHKGNQYKLDLKKGITLSLLDQGILPQKIHHSTICTFCNDRFPSYRRQKTENQRLFNFIIRR